MPVSASDVVYAPDNNAENADAVDVSIGSPYANNQEAIRAIVAYLLNINVFTAQGIADALVGDADALGALKAGITAALDGDDAEAIAAAFGTSPEALLALVGEIVDDDAARNAMKVGLGSPRMHVDTSDPTANDDGIGTNGGPFFANGDFWLNSANRKLFVLSDNATNAAVWAQQNVIAPISFAFNPTANDDAIGSAGNGVFAAGSIWRNTVTGVLWFCAVATTGSAVWSIINTASAQSFAFSPTVNDDASGTAGRGSFGAGSTWVDTVANQIYICADATTGSAIWANVSSSPAAAFSSSSDPTADDDGANTGGNGVFAVGSAWVNTTSDVGFICVDNSEGAAVWAQMNSAAVASVSEFSAASDPTVNDDGADTSGNGAFVLGAVWVNTSTNKAFLLVDATAGSAIWKEASTIKDNLTAGSAPTVNDDSGDGYSVGSRWINTTDDTIFICVDSTVAAAVWLNLTGVASVVDFRTNAAGAKALTPTTVWNSMAEVTLADAATIGWDMDTGFDFKVTIAGNRLLDTPTNLKVGQKGRLTVIQGSGGSHLLSYESIFEFSLSEAPTLSTDEGAEDVLYYDVKSPTRVFVALGLEAVG